MKDRRRRIRRDTDAIDARGLRATQLLARGADDDPDGTTLDGALERLDNLRASLRALRDANVVEIADEL